MENVQGKIARVINNIYWSCLLGIRYLWTDSTQIYCHKIQIKLLFFCYALRYINLFRRVLYHLQLLFSGMRMQVRLLCSTDKSYLYMSDTFDPTSNNHIINFMVVLFYKILYVANAFCCRHFLHFLDLFRLIKPGNRCNFTIANKLDWRRSHAK